MKIQSLTPESLRIATLGEPKILSPLDEFFEGAEKEKLFSNGRRRIVVDHEMASVTHTCTVGRELPAFEAAGARREIFFDPRETVAGIITCGGICPGLNDVIRSIVNTAFYRYGVQRIFGIPYGFEGLNRAYGHTLLNLTPGIVEGIGVQGGTVLGTSRGPQAPETMVDRLQELGINVLFVIGGDGSQRGALDIVNEADKRGLKIAVVGIPKTIDNDMIYMDKSFGYETAVAAATVVLAGAHVEAVSVPNGLGIVKLMGRYSGFIASQAALACGGANFVLIPEVPFSLEGQHGLLETLYRRMLKRGHALLVVAEGAGQEHLNTTGEHDASGNLLLGDIGLFLRDKIVAFFAERKTPLAIKYIDPSYIIRSTRASTNDSIYCMRLGQAAVHAAMAGKTGMVVARWHHAYVHVPISLVVSARRYVDPTSDSWLSVIESTGQPAVFHGD